LRSKFSQATGFLLGLTAGLLFGRATGSVLLGLAAGLLLLERLATRLLLGEQRLATCLLVGLLLAQCLFALVHGLAQAGEVRDHTLFVGLVGHVDGVEQFGHAQVLFGHVKGVVEVVDGIVLVEP